MNLYADARKALEESEALEIKFDVGEPNNLIDRAMCIRYGVGDTTEEPFLSGGLHNARTWRTRPLLVGGLNGTLFNTGQEALEALGEDHLLYDLFVGMVTSGGT